MNHIDLTDIRERPEARLSFLTSFTCFAEDDWCALRDSLSVLGPHLPALLDAVYDHLLSFDDTRRVFLGPHGELDPAYMALRKEHLTNWVLKLASVEDRTSFAHYLVAVGRHHAGVPGQAGRSVAPRYLVGLTSFVQTHLWTALFAALPDQPQQVRRLGLAWNKMLLVQLEMFLKAIVPHWDEG